MTTSRLCPQSASRSRVEGRDTPAPGDPGSCGPPGPAVRWADSKRLGSGCRAPRRNAVHSSVHRCGKRSSPAEYAAEQAAGGRFDGCRSTPATSWNPWAGVTFARRTIEDRTRRSRGLARSYPHDGRPHASRATTGHPPTVVLPPMGVCPGPLDRYRRVRRRSWRGGLGVVSVSWASPPWRRSPVRRLPVSRAAGYALPHVLPAPVLDRGPLLLLRTGPAACRVHPSPHPRGAGP